MWLHVCKMLSTMKKDKVNWSSIETLTMVKSTLKDCVASCVDLQHWGCKKSPCAGLYWGYFLMLMGGNWWKGNTWSKTEVCHLWRRIIKSFCICTICKHSNLMIKVCGLWGFFAKRADQVMLEMYNNVKRKTCFYWGHIIENPPAHSECGNPKYVLF